MKIDTTAVRPADFEALVEALESLVVSKADLAEVAGAIEDALPGLIAKSGRKDATMPRWRWDHVIVARDEDGRIARITSTPVALDS